MYLWLMAIANDHIVKIRHYRARAIIDWKVMCIPRSSKLYSGHSPTHTSFETTSSQLFLDICINTYLYHTWNSPYANDVIDGSALASICGHNCIQSSRSLPVINLRPHKTSRCSAENWTIQAACNIPTFCRAKT